MAVQGERPLPLSAAAGRAKVAYHGARGARSLVAQQGLQPLGVVAVDGQGRSLLMTSRRNALCGNFLDIHFSKLHVEAMMLFQARGLASTQRVQLYDSCNFENGSAVLKFL